MNSENLGNVSFLLGTTDKRDSTVSKYNVDPEGILLSCGGVSNSQ